MKIQQLTGAGALTSVHSTPAGLSASEASRRFLEYGPNELPRVRGEPLALAFAKEFVHFFAIILWIAAALAFFAELRQPGQGMVTLGFAIIGVILVNGGFSFWQAFRAERTILALQQLLPDRARVVRDGNIHEILTTELVPGDIILLEAGDDVPADSRLLEGFALRVNDATITGESVPRSRDPEPCDAPQLMGSRNILLAGTSIVAGQGKALVFATGRHTEFGRIAHLTQTAGDELAPLQKEIIRLSRVIAALALIIGVAFFFVGRAIGLPFWSNFIFAIGVIVANVPEGLLPTVTLALAMGSQRMAKRNALIRHLPAVETLGSTTVICTDKTGTLTENRMCARRLFIGDAFYDVDDSQRLAECNRTFGQFFEVARSCNDVKEIHSDRSPRLAGDPMEVALLELAQKVAALAPELPRIDEIPFDSERKRLSTIHRTKGETILYCKGAPEVILARCTRVRLNDGETALTLELRSTFQSAEEKMAQEGFRVLAFASRELPSTYDLSHAEEELTLLGFVGLEDPPRREVSAAMRSCAAAGIRVIMVTGDHPRTAAAIARQIGLVNAADPTVITGDELQRMSDTQLQLALDRRDLIFARVAADQKMRVVAALKRKGEIVAVTGDGVNDAPALKTGDIGIAMGVTGTDVAREAADMILLDDNFASIVAAIEEGRAVFANIRKFLTYILTSNVPELIPYLAFVLFRIPLPLTVIQILAVDLGTDMVPALGLGAEKPTADTMQSPPRPRTERLLNWPVVVRSYLFLGVIQAVAAISVFLFLLRGTGWRMGETLAANDPIYLRATAGCLSAIVVMQIVNVFLCRSDSRSAFQFGFFSNKLLLAGVVAEIALILLIDYTQAGNVIFGTLPLPVSAWLCAIPFAIAMLALEEFRKWLVRRRAK